MAASLVPAAGQARVGEASALQLAQARGVQRVDATGSDQLRQR
jgi:hypothetical protein